MSGGAGGSAINCTGVHCRICAKCDKLIMLHRGLARNHLPSAHDSPPQPAPTVPSGNATECHPWGPPHLPGLAWYTDRRLYGERGTKRADRKARTAIRRSARLVELSPCPGNMYSVQWHEMRQKSCYRRTACFLALHALARHSIRTGCRCTDCMLAYVSLTRCASCVPLLLVSTSWPWALVGRD